ncbi:relaxase/mobilization nuclease domain-containing protein [Campylobacter devanensis]|uniref:relaxase/mobilization nuclease domain-containing protein n=1 Tax=Campylobacter devanensis TaxID=3161138 RepID=UPI000A347ED5
MFKGGHRARNRLCDEKRKDRGEALVSGLHCEPETVKEEMQATKELWGKTDGRTYKHYVQSYHEDEEITPEQAHKERCRAGRAYKGMERA